MIIMYQVFLIFTTLWANSADDKLTIFLLFFPENRIKHFIHVQIVSKEENRIWHSMQIPSIGDSLHEMSYPAF